MPVCIADSDPSCAPLTTRKESILQQAAAVARRLVTNEVTTRDKKLQTWTHTNRELRERKVKF